MDYKFYIGMLILFNNLDLSFTNRVFYLINLDTAVGLCLEKGLINWSQIANYHAWN